MPTNQAINIHIDLAQFPNIYVHVLRAVGVGALLSEVLVMEKLHHSDPADPVHRLLDLQNLLRLPERMSASFPLYRIVPGDQRFASLLVISYTCMTL